MRTLFVAFALLAGLSWAACSDDDFGSDFNVTHDQSVMLDGGGIDLADLSSGDGL